MPPHVLSRVINDGFGKNFFDFINTYRIEEFKRRADDPHYKNFTLLGIAYEVGFNSKSAFNRSFKKITGQTPREHFNLMQEPVE
jgi:AraC-like DNA-binding protein